MLNHWSCHLYFGLNSTKELLLLTLFNTYRTFINLDVLSLPLSSETMKKEKEKKRMWQQTNELLLVRPWQDLTFDSLTLEIKSNQIRKIKILNYKHWFTVSPTIYKSCFNLIHNIVSNWDIELWTFGISFGHVIANGALHYNIVLSFHLDPSMWHCKFCKIAYLVLNFISIL